MKQSTIAFSWINPLDTSSGGIERVTQRLMEGLGSRGFRCIYLQHDVVSDRFVYQGQAVSDLHAFLREQKVDCLVNQNGYSSHLTEILAAAEWRGRYIVCHHNEPFYLRKIFDIHWVIAEILGRGRSWKRRVAGVCRLLTFPLWRKRADLRIVQTQDSNYRRCDQYVLLSESFIPQFAGLLCRSELPKAIAIPNPLSFDVSPKQVSRYVKEDCALIVARLNDTEKRISAALRAWRLIENRTSGAWELKIVGDGPDRASLQALAKTLGLRRVKFLGRQDPLPHFKSAALFFMTSRVEGWGVTVTEAMQTGSVPIAFDAYSSLRDIIEDGRTGVIVPDGNLEKFAAEAVRLIDDGVWRESLATEAILASQRYTLSRVLERWSAIV